MNDQTVRRVGQLVTTFFDALAVLLFAAAACWWLWVAVAPPVGLAVAGAVIMLFSLLAQRQATPKAARVESAADKPLPGPADPGTVHVMGR